MKHRSLTKKEEERALIQIIDELLKPIPQAGKHRKSQWERGWAQNVKSGDIRPGYFGKHPVNRLNGKLVKGVSPDYERQMLYTIVDSLARKYLIEVKNIYEFGCGTGHNLQRMKLVNPKAGLYGADWVTSACEMVSQQGFYSFQFDYFNPSKYRLSPNSGVYTVASLEQVGTRYKPFVQYLIRNKPKVVVHIEPIPELLDPKNLLDYLSIKYMEKRKYLSGYLDYLRSLEKKGKLKIIEARRSGIGSMFIDGYSIVVWKPL